MKQIVPVNIWVDGAQIPANYIALSLVYDNLENAATFYYQLINQTEIVNEDTSVSVVKQSVTSGNVPISGADYENWGNDDNINRWAYTWVAGKLNLQISPSEIANFG
jgi:hypothetical protein